MSQKLHGGGLERASQVPDLHFKFCNLGPKSAFFFCPKPPYGMLKTAKCGGTVATLHMQLDLPVPKGPLGPYNSTICLRTTPKRPQKAPKLVHMGRRQPQTKTGIEYWHRAGGERNIVSETSTTNEVRAGKRMRAAQKGLKMSRIHRFGHQIWTRIIFAKP